MSDLSRLHVLFGGTFDPIHYGHLRSTQAVARQINVDHITLLPNGIPAHRPQPAASAAQRLAMIKLAVAGLPLYQIDERELQRSCPSRTINTLTELRAERGRQPIAFIIGQDALVTLHQWHRWQELLTLCHLLVCKRPGYAEKRLVNRQQRWLNRHLTLDSSLLHRQPAGQVFITATPQLAVSATEIRQRCLQGKNVDQLVPPAVADYIRQNALYGLSPAG